MYENIGLRMKGITMNIARSKRETAIASVVETPTTFVEKMINASLIPKGPGVKDNNNDNIETIAIITAITYIAIFLFDKK